MAIIIQTAPVKRNEHGEKVDIALVRQDMTKIIGTGKIRVLDVIEISNCCRLLAAKIYGLHKLGLKFQ